MYWRAAGSLAQARNHDGVVHGAVFAQRLHHLGDRGFLLTHGDIDTDDAAVFLVDDGIHADGRLADLAVADDQFALPAPDGGHGVDGLHAGVHGFVHRLPGDNAGGDDLDARKLFRFDGAFAVQGGCPRNR